MRWASPVCWAGSPRWDNFQPVFIWEILSQTPGLAVIALAIFCGFLSLFSEFSGLFVSGHFAAHSSLSTLSFLFQATPPRLGQTDRTKLK